MDDIVAPDIRTPLGFLRDREDYFRVSVVRSSVGHGWDVVLRLDGTYDAQEAAVLAAERVKEAVLGIEGLDHGRWFSWEAS